MKYEFYYLDGVEKKGPYTLEEILNRKLPPDTLIFLPEKGKWEKLSEISLETTINNDVTLDLKTEEFVLENEQQKLDNASPPGIIEEIGSPSVKPAKPNRPKFFLLISLVSILLASISVFVHIKIDKKSLKARIEKMMLEKKAICDFQYSEPIGELTPIYPYSADDYKQIILRKLGNEGTLEHMPKDSVLITDNILSIYDKQENPLYFDFYKKYIEFFQYKSGGLTIYTLTKTTNGFDVVTTQSKNYAYFVREQKYNEVLQIWTPTYRAGVREAHEKLFTSYTDLHAPNGYIKNSKLDILKTPSQKSVFYELENLPPSDTSEFGGSSSKWANWHSINSGSTLDVMINGDSYPYSNEQCAIWIRDEGLHYEYSLSLNSLFIFLGIYFISFFTISFAAWKFFASRKTSNNPKNLV